jgi:glycosyltransferase involved in cell wall biosynthesis
MKIAIFTPTFLPKCSGAEIFHHNLALRLAAIGHEPVVVMPRAMKRRLDESPLAPTYATLGYPANQWSLFKRWPAFGYAVSRWTLDRFQARHHFDLWHSVVLSPTGACFADWQHRRRIAGLVRAVGDDVPNGGASLIPTHVRKSISRAQRVVSLSEAMSAGLATAGVDRTRIVEIPNAVDFAIFRKPFDRMAFRNSKGIKGKVCLCVARNHPQKDLPTLFRAFSKLRRSLPEPVNLVVAGRGIEGYQLDPELSQGVKLLEIIPSDPLEFPPTALVEWYRAADIFMLTSELEGFSSALVEAMAAGLPVVATNVPGIRERVENGRSGWLCPFGDDAGIAAAVEQLFLNEEQRQVFGEHAKQAAHRFSWEDTVSAYDATYKKLVQRVSGGSGCTP